MWKRRDASQRAVLRRLLAWGAVVGLAAGLVAQAAVTQEGVGGVPEWLVRLALVLPGVLFLTWMLVARATVLDEPIVDAPIVEIDPEAKLERIEAAFDTAAVPQARRTSMDPASSGLRTEYHRSLGARPEDADPVLRETFGLPTRAAAVPATPAKVDELRDAR
jgi:hypothetical protein